MNQTSKMVPSHPILSPFRSASEMQLPRCTMNDSVCIYVTMTNDDFRFLPTALSEATHSHT